MRQVNSALELDQVSEIWSLFDQTIILTQGGPISKLKTPSFESLVHPIITLKSVPISVHLYLKLTSFKCVWDSLSNIDEEAGCALMASG